MYIIRLEEYIEKKRVCFLHDDQRGIANPSKIVKRFVKTDQSLSPR